MNIYKWFKISIVAISFWDVCFSIKAKKCSKNAQKFRLVILKYFEK